MASMVAKGCSSSGNQMSSPISAQEKGSRNKRKFHADMPLGDPYKFLSAAQNESASYEFSAGKFNIIPTHGYPSGCDMCNVNQDRSDATKFNFSLSSTAGSSQVVSQIGQEVDADETHDADWGDLNESQLEELVVKNLDTNFRSAIKKIVANGYSEEVAMKAVLRSGFCYGSKDTVSNIVDNTLGYLNKGRGIDPSSEHCFEDLQQLEKYIVGELVSLLREVRPFFSAGDAMWCLLICDMNLSHACAMEGDPLSSFVGDGASNGCSSLLSNSHLKMEARSSELNLPNPCKQHPSTSCVQPEIPSIAGVPKPTKLKNPHPNGQLEKENLISSGDNANKSFSAARASQPLVQEEKIGSSRKAHSSSSKRDSMLCQKSFHLEKHHRTYVTKGGSRTAKLSGLGGLILDKKLKSVSDSTVVNLKSASINISKASSNLSTNDGAGPSSPPAFNAESVNTISTTHKINAGTALPLGSLALPTPSMTSANTDFSLLLPLKGKSAKHPVSCSPETPNCVCAEMPYDKTMDRWVTQGKMDQLILKVVPRVQEMQNQLQEWTEWANQKIMQAAHRLGKEKAELKTLRQEKEEVDRLKKEKQTLEESTMKKLSEMENALGKACGQVDQANSAVRRLEGENAALRQAMEAANLRAAESDANCQEVSKREKTTLMKFQSLEKQKTFLREEISTNKRTLNQLRQQLQQSRELHYQVKGRGEQEEKAKEALLMEASSLRKEKEQSDASAKSKDDVLNMKAENKLQRCKREIQKLEKEISRLRLKNDSSKIAALRRGIDGCYASRRISDAKYATDPKDLPAPDAFELVTDLYDYSGSGGVKRERECVMCLSEEMSVVFLPCAHQVVCTKCNELHEKQGMKDCPSCRTPIHHRISVRYART